MKTAVHLTFVGFLFIFIAFIAAAGTGAPSAAGENPPQTAPQTQTAPAPPEPGTLPPATEPEPAAPLPTAGEIAAAIEEALERDADVAGHAELQVRCEVGIVTISGKADTLHVLHQAERRAGDVRGVLDVVVTAKVSTAGTLDSRILMGIQSALDNPTFRGDNISVWVEEGLARLNGTATTYARKLLAEQSAAEVPGVIRIVNNLQVAAPSEGDDAELARRVTLLLTGGLTPVPGAFEVAVRDRQATLRGRVPLFSHRVQAERLALSVGGVISVDNRLKVDPALSQPRVTVEIQP